MIHLGMRITLFQHSLVNLIISTIAFLCLDARQHMLNHKISFSLYFLVAYEFCELLNFYAQFCVTNQLFFLALFLTVNSEIVTLLNSS